MNRQRACNAMDTYDVCIVGAGVVGCAIARELRARRWLRPLRIIVVERHADGGLEAAVGEHDRDLAFGIADRIAIIHEGTILFVGTPAQVKANPDPQIQQFIKADFKRKSI